MKLGPALVLTPDLIESLGFYRDILGLTLTGQFEGHLVFDSGTWSLHVFRCEGKTPPHRHGRDGGSVITFEVASIDQTMEALKAKGVKFLHEAPTVNRDIGLRYAAFMAPGGNTHELVERI